MQTRSPLPAQVHEKTSGPGFAPPPDHLHSPSPPRMHVHGQFPDVEVQVQGHSLGVWPHLTLGALAAAGLIWFVTAAASGTGWSTLWLGFTSLVLLGCAEAALRAGMCVETVSFDSSKHEIEIVMFRPVRLRRKRKNAVLCRKGWLAGARATGGARHAF